MTYLDMVKSIVFALIRAAQEGNWPLHMAVNREQIPWCFAYDKTMQGIYLHTMPR